MVYTNFSTGLFLQVTTVLHVYCKKLQYTVTETLGLSHNF